MGYRPRRLLFMNGEGPEDIAKELEMGMARMDMLKAQMESLRAQRETLISVMVDHDSSLEVLRSIKEGSSSQAMVPLGAMVYLKADLDGLETCLVNEGAGVFVQTEIGLAMEKISKRRSSLEQAIGSLEGQLNEIAAQYNRLASRTQEMYNQQVMNSQGPRGNF